MEGGGGLPVGTTGFRHLVVFCGGMPLEAQSSFKLQRFLCSKGYAMDNLDETQSIHLSLKLHPYVQSNASNRAS